MARKLTVNDMILRTISTRRENEPRYAEVLRDMGYEVTRDYRSLRNNYWIVNGVTFSGKGSYAFLEKNRRAVMSNGDSVRKGDDELVKRVDFASLCKCGRERTVGNPFRELRKSRQETIDIKKIAMRLREEADYLSANRDKLVSEEIERAVRMVDERIARAEEKAINADSCYRRSHKEYKNIIDDLKSKEVYIAS